MLAGAPAALRAFARMRHELREGALPRATRERIALAVAERRGDTYSVAQHARTGRAAGLGLDEVSRARSFTSADEKEAALLAFLEALLDSDQRPSAHLGEEAREAGWTDEEILEAVAHVALAEFQTLIANAAALPQDQIDPAILPVRRLASAASGSAAVRTWSTPSKRELLRRGAWVRSQSRS